MEKDMCPRNQYWQKFSFKRTIPIIGVLLLPIFFCTYYSEQPINFNHKAHFQYFNKGTHRKAKLKLHEDLLGEIPEELEKGDCVDCHGSFEEAIEDTPLIKDCAGCHQIFLETDLRERPRVRPCVGCHRNAIRGYRASLPNIEICVACHQEPITEDPEEKKLMAYLKKNEKINWIRINNNLTGDTHFSHERHVAIGKVDCRDCHGKVDETTSSFALRMKLKMEKCIDCHEKTIASNDCLACHY